MPYSVLVEMLECHVQILVLLFVMVMPYSVRHQLATTALRRMLSPIARILKGGTGSNGSESPTSEGSDTAAMRRASPPRPLGALLH